MFIFAVACDTLPPWPLDVVATVDGLVTVVDVVTLLLLLLLLAEEHSEELGDFYLLTGTWHQSASMTA